MPSSVSSRLLYPAPRPPFLIGPSQTFLQFHHPLRRQQQKQRFSQPPPDLIPSRDNTVHGVHTFRHGDDDERGREEGESLLGGESVLVVCASVFLSYLPPPWSTATNARDEMYHTCIQPERNIFGLEGSPAAYRPLKGK